MVGVYTGYMVFSNAGNGEKKKRKKKDSFSEIERKKSERGKAMEYSGCPEMSCNLLEP